MRAILMETAPKSTVYLLVTTKGTCVGEHISNMISRLHFKCGLKMSYCNRDARKSFETWGQKLPVKDRIARYVAHSEKVAEDVYTAPDRRKAAEVGQVLEFLAKNTRTAST